MYANDEEGIAYLTEKVFPGRKVTRSARLGGLTNHSYDVTLDDGNRYVYRFAGEGTEEIINRGDEKISTELATSLGIDTELFYFGENYEKIMRYVEDAETITAETMKDPKRIAQVAEIFRKLHTCGKDTGVKFEIFEMVDAYLKVIRDLNVPMFDDFDDMRETVMKINRDTEADLGRRRVPCHNDALCANWVASPERLYLIDWEYAGMNDPFWDIADVSIEAEFNSEEDDLILKEYLQKEPTEDDRKHFLAYKIFVDYLWTLWAKARVPYDGQPMEDWAVERYARFKENVKTYTSLYN